MSEAGAVIESQVTEIETVETVENSLESQASGKLSIVTAGDVKNALRMLLQNK